MYARWIAIPIVDTNRCFADVKLMLLHDGKSEESVKSFFAEVHELYIKVPLSHEAREAHQSKEIISFPSSGRPPRQPRRQDRGQAR